MDEERPLAVTLTDTEEEDYYFQTRLVYGFWSLHNWFPHLFYFIYGAKKNND